MSSTLGLPLTAIAIAKEDGLPGVSGRRSRRRASQRTQRRARSGVQGGEPVSYAHEGPRMKGGVQGEL